ncbi:MAG: hypothetical protein ACRC8B_16250 [Aeromonas sobria]|uniref:hypothetical protein n=1 Tax=Aeromonas sobria TaxID=646 RepID=UPI003F328792
MSKKAAARAARKAQKQERFEASNAPLIAKVNTSQQPRQVVTPPINEGPRLAPHLERAAATAEKAPKAIKDGSRFSSRVTWCDTRADLKDSWSWGELRAWEKHEWDEIIHPPFKDFAKLTWKEIDSHSSDTGHKKHHDHGVGDLIEEAQQRWRDLDLEQFETVFRFRLGNTERVWGFIVQAHFHIVWWDREHSIYPTER